MELFNCDFRLLHTPENGEMVLENVVQDIYTIE